MGPTSADGKRLTDVANVADTVVLHLRLWGDSTVYSIRGPFKAELA